MRAMTSRSRWLELSVLTAAGLIASLGGCNCADEAANLGDTITPWDCDAAGRRPGLREPACPDEERFINGECGAARCDATTPSTCCPGTACDPGGICIVPPQWITTCETPAD